MSTTANLGMTLPAGTDWADIAVLNANFELIDAAMGAARAAEPYSDAKTYAVGDYCTRDGALFKCTVAITTPEAWTVGHWTATSVAAELLAIIASLSNKVNKTGDTITGDMTFKGVNAYTDNAWQGSGLAMADKNGARTGWLGVAGNGSQKCDFWISNDHGDVSLRPSVGGAAKVYDVPIATATPPTEYEAGLMNGFTKQTGDDFGGVRYCKTQDGIVIGSVRVQTTSAITMAQFATMPSDCLPTRAIYTVCWRDWGSGNIAHMGIDPNGLMWLTTPSASGVFAGIFAYRANS